MMPRDCRHGCRWAAAVLALAAVLRADQAAEIAAVHIAAIGGRERIEALLAYRGTGHVVLAGRTVGLVVIAARPGRLRVELHDADRTIIQATDGTNPPWVLDTSAQPRRSTLLDPVSTQVFLTEAEFDDPLVGGGRYGCVIDFAGDAKVDDRPLLRLLVTQRLTKNFFLLVDPETYFIVARIDSTEGDGNAAIVTHYGDFRPVAGVLLPYRVTVLANRQAPREAVFDRIEANPVLGADVFAKPD